MWGTHRRSEGGGEGEPGEERRKERVGREEGEMLNFAVKKRKVDTVVQAKEAPFGRET